MSPHPWPELHEEDRWLIATMEERFARSHQSADEMRARARELREEAEQSEVRGFREAALALADRYEEAAASRVGSR